MMKEDDTMVLSVLTVMNHMEKIPVSKVMLPGKLGKFTILKNHAPLVSVLERGNIDYTSDGVCSSVPIDGGFVMVYENDITICAVQES